MSKKTLLCQMLGLAGLAAVGQAAYATCDDINTAAVPQLANVIAMINAKTSGGFGLPMWWAAVDETGKICGINNSAGSGAAIGNSSWLGSRQIAVQKANAANAFSLDAFAISTTNLYGLTLPGGSLWGLQASNPIDASIAYLGAPETYGTASDPLLYKRIGGVNVFGGGLALYNAAGKKVGALGVSGDTSCTDHAVAWKIRTLWGLNHVPNGFVKSYTPAPAFTVLGDEMVIRTDNSLTAVQNTFKQVNCANPPTQGAENGTIWELPPV